MVANKPIFMKLQLATPIFMKNPYTKFHPNPTKCLVADTRSQTDGRMWRSCYFIRNVQRVPLATEPGISLIILTPMKIL